MEGCVYEPLVSIVMPVYNGSNFIKQALDSALNQTYKNIEIIVVNDGSNDGGATSEILQKYQDQIIIIERKQNRGISFSLNEGINSMRGEYFTWLSHDDLYKPTKVEEQVLYLNELIEKFPEKKEYICLCGASETIDANNNFIKKNISKPTSVTLRSMQELLLDNISNYEIGGCTVLIPREAFVRCGGFDESLRTVQDADMWYRMILQGYTFCFLNKSLVQSRIHKTQTGTSLSDLFFIERSKLQEKLSDRIIDSDDVNTISYVLRTAVAQQKMGYSVAANKCYKFCRQKGESVLDKLKIECCKIYSTIYGMCRNTAKELYRMIIIR